MLSVLKKSSSGCNLSRDTLKCLAARSMISSRVFSCVGIIQFFDETLTWPDSGQVWLQIRALHELAQSRFDGRLSEQLAEQVDFLLQLVMRDGLNELLGGDGGAAIKFAELRSGGAGST